MMTIQTNPTIMFDVLHSIVLFFPLTKIIHICVKYDTFIYSRNMIKYTSDPKSEGGER
jgi:hypothetical protein